MIRIQKSKFVGNIQFREFDQSEPEIGRASCRERV